MRRKQVALAILGFVVGAVALAGGSEEEDWELIEQLRALQASAERVILKVPVTVDYAPPVGTGYQLALFPIYDLTCGVWDHIPPTQDYLNEGSETPLFGGIAEEAPQPYGTIEELMELVRTSVDPASWEEGGTITATGQTLIVYHSPVVVRKVGAFLDMLRERSHACVNVEVEMVDMPVALHRELAVGKGAALSDAQTEGLHRAIAGGSASVAFAGRALGLARQRFYITHGAQHAVLDDMDVEVAQTARTSDPIVNSLFEGGVVDVRASIGGDRSNLTLDLDARHAALRTPIRMGETEENGVIDLPIMARSGSRLTVTVPSGRWVVAGICSSSGESIRVILARATVVEPKGGAR